MLVCFLRAITAQRDILIWMERVRTVVNPADRSSRDRELPFPTEAKQEVAAFDELFSIFDLSLMFQQTKRAQLLSPFSQTSSGHTSPNAKND